MVSRRSRSKKTVGGQLNSLAAAVDKADKKAGIGSDAINSGNLAENAVDRAAIAPNAVGPEQIDRGAVGTENLGIVNEITADSDFNFITPGGVRVNGTLIGGSGSSLTVSETPPMSPSKGSLWLYSADGSLFVWMIDAGETIGQWVEVGESGLSYSDISNKILNFSNRNRVINGNGAVNQRVAVSGASLASGAYFLDNWLSGAASNSVTWTGDEQGRVMTVPASKSIKTGIEKRDMPAGSYTLSQAGTAQGRVYKVGGSVPAYAALPLTATLDGTADVVVEFGSGTVSNVQLEAGAYATPFERESYGVTLAKCLRYFMRRAGSYGFHIGLGFQQSATASRLIIETPPMRTSPTLRFADLVWSDNVTYENNVSGIVGASVSPETGFFVFTVTHASGGGARTPGTLYVRNFGGTGIGYFELDAGIL